ncbi:MAG: acylneuraminate cytidylyltransferase family protein [Gallionellaceae bacterium]|nr:acylneuraminate cytidylyltransferase family protein [Gallionellaceae bacterium]
MTAPPSPLRSWAFVPARGGSKAIPLKNLADLGGRQLMDYCIEAAKSSRIFERIICSTEHAGIAARAVALGIEHDQRPLELCGDEVSTRAVILEFLERHRNELPDLLFIVEPTSPFLRPKDIAALLERMQENPVAVTGQTIAQPPHTHHAWNQREMRDGQVRFIFEERKKVFAKQNKPVLYVFGNLIACRTAELLAGGDVFAEPSVGVEIDWPYDINIDYPNDLTLANILLKAGLVNLPHMHRNSVCAS